MGEEVEADEEGEVEEEDEGDELYVDDGEDMKFVKRKGDDAKDEITDELLTSRHVVWRSPDGSTTMRFNLSTMRKIAARQHQWVDPPHFRQPMSEQMRSQIRVKFGPNVCALPCPALPCLPLSRAHGASSSADVSAPS